jgi:hypothetical protein
MHALLLLVEEDNRRCGKSEKDKSIGSDTATGIGARSCQW